MWGGDNLEIKVRKAPINTVQSRVEDSSCNLGASEEVQEQQKIPTGDRISERSWNCLVVLMDTALFDEVKKGDPRRT